MKKMKKILALVLTVALLAAAIGGTLAYLQDEDSDVNVMTLGNVYIEQIEQERDANGNLVDFTQNKPAYPAVGPIEWADTGVVVNGTEYKVFTPDLKNVVDKIVTVKNTGKSDAYVRTVVAIEAPDYDPDNLIHINYNGADVESSAPIEVEIDGVDYVVFAFTYKEALAAGKVSAPSLVQVFLDSKATNEDCAKFGDTWEIIVLSQAVQAQGFADAKTALDTAFGEVKENAKQWFTETLEEPFAIVTIPGADDTLTNADGDVTVLGKNLMIDTTDSKMGLDVGKIPLDTAYQFEPSISAEEVEESEYADWHADFVVSVDKDIPAYGIGLAGYYDAWCSLNNDKWVLLASDEPIKAGTELRLVEAMGQGSITVSYRELCQYGNDGIGFLCGAKDMSGMTVLGDITVGQIPAGTTLTVELRLYETEEPSPENGNSANVETGNYITTGTYRYTFE